MKLRPGGLRRPGRTALLGVAAVMLLGACSSEPGTGGNSNGTGTGAVQLSPASGPTSSTPTWSTSVACPAGFQGSAIFSELQADGKSLTTIAPIVNDTQLPFKGTLLGPVAKIQYFGHIPNGGSQELFIRCASLPGGTGLRKIVMNIFITYSADGSTYTTSSTAPTGVATASDQG